MDKDVILIIGLSRSGTTYATHLLGASQEFHVEVEPHALWKSGNFHHLNDEEFDIVPSTIQSIRNNFLKAAKGQPILEKSPINALRPELVHAVFPEAKVIYIERDPVRCIHSNYKRSLANDSFKPSITLRKYFMKSGGEDLPYATSQRKLFSQITFKDIFPLMRFVIWMAYMRNIKGIAFPFGPKLKDFTKIVQEEGLLEYHVRVFKKAGEKKLVYQSFYGDKMRAFRLENLFKDIKTLAEMYEFAGVQIGNKALEDLFNSINNERVSAAIKPSAIDKQIKDLLGKP